MKHLLIILSSSVFLAGCFHPGGETKVSINSNDSTQEQTREMSKMAEAMQAGESVECILTDENQNTMTYYMKNNRMKMTGIRSDQDGSETTVMLNDGDYIYSWDEVKKEGFKFEVPDDVPNPETATPDKTETNLPDFSNPADQQAYENQGYNIECELKEVDDSIFVAPTDVEFTDLASMMEKFGGGY